MTTQTEALKLALEAFETLTQYNMVRANIFRRFEPTCTGDYVDLREFREKAKPAITAIKEALAQPEQERCVGCEACIDTACGRDECPKGWPKALQPEQEPVAKLKLMMEESAFEGRLELSDALLNIEQFFKTPPQRKPLTDEQIGKCIDEVNATSQYGHHHFGWHLQLARAIEAKLKEKNT